LEQKEFEKQWINMNKVTPGPQQIGGAVFKRAHPNVKLAMWHLTKTTFDNAMLTDKQRADVRAPIYKRGNPAELNNFRPVSMMDEDLKLYERLVLVRMRKWDESTPQHSTILQDGTHPSSFGGKQGRDAQIALMTIKEKARSRQFNKMEEGETALIVADIKSAFPSLWREGLAFHLMKKKIPDALYKRWRTSKIKLHGKVKVGNYPGLDVTYPQGVNQGAPLAADEWGWSLESLSDSIQDLPDDAVAQWPQLPMIQQEKLAKDIGVNVRAINKWKDVFQYVDDVSTFPTLHDNGTTIDNAVTSAMDKSAQKLRASWAQKKTVMVVLGRQNDQVGKTTYTLANKELADVVSTKLLGEILQNQIYGGTT
jgi:hypothetical protein